MLLDQQTCCRKGGPLHGPKSGLLSNTRKRIVWRDTCWQSKRSDVKWSELAQSCLTLCNPRTVDHQALPSMGFSRQGCWSGLPFPSPGELSDPGIKPRSPALRAGALPSEPPGKPYQMYMISVYCLPFCRLPFYSVVSAFCCIKFLNFHEIQLVYFIFCCLYLSCHSQEIIAKSNVVKLLSFLEEFYS